MFGNEKQSDTYQPDKHQPDKHQPDKHQPDWVNRFEAKQWAADELAVARLLYDARPAWAQLPLAPRQTLRQRLIAQHNQQYNPFYGALRYAIITAAVTVVAGLL